MEILPATAGATIVDAVQGVVSDNIAPLLFILGTFVGVALIRRVANKNLTGKV